MFIEARKGRIVTGGATTIRLSVKTDAGSQGECIDRHEEEKGIGGVRITVSCLFAPKPSRWPLVDVRIFEALLPIEVIPELGTSASRVSVNSLVCVLHSDSFVVCGPLSFVTDV